MGRFRLLLCTTLLASLFGCGRPLVREVQIEELSVVTHGLAGVDVTARMSNAADRELRIESIEGVLFYDRGEVLRIRLHRPVTIAPDWSGDVRLRCRMQVPDRAALYGVCRKMERGEIQRMRVALSVSVVAGRQKKKVVRRISLSDFLDTFGVTTEDLLNVLGE